MVRRQIILALVLGTAISITACGSSASTEAVISSTHDSTTTSASTEAAAESSEDEAQKPEEDISSEIVTDLSKIDNTKWQYNEEDNVYYQLGIQYCENPADTNYEELAVIVPAAYMDASDNGDGTYTCTLSTLPI